MADINLKGMGVALITPFKEDESVDYEALGKLVDYQVQNGTDYLVVLGTTAETPTLTEEEKKNIISLVAKFGFVEVKCLVRKNWLRTLHKAKKVVVETIVETTAERTSKERKIIAKRI